MGISRGRAFCLFGPYSADDRTSQRLRCRRGAADGVGQGRRGQEEAGRRRVPPGHEAEQQQLLRELHPGRDEVRQG